ncbi:MAG: type III-B CRISPR module-associated protein Cmr3 [Deltaproteobacteria bacterium]|nr:type III-B CRISPR module-associated protein Cmr3 [Deltaproteobacteria bacterium]
MWIHIEPLDVLLFRDSRPFDAGEQARATGIFPPTGLPFAGALRSRIIKKQGIAFSDYKDKENKKGWDLVGSPDDFGPLSFAGPFLTLGRNHARYPIPRDLVKTKEGHLERLKLVECAKDSGASSPPCLSCHLVSGGGETNEAEDGYLDDVEFMHYLKNDVTPKMQGEAVAVNEPRVGIGRNAAGTAEKGLIYTAVYTRLVKKDKNKERAAFLFRMQSENGGEEALLGEKGIISLGGEARSAYFSVLKEEEAPSLFSEKTKNELLGKLTGKSKFKLCLLTPAVFKKGWLPDGIDEQGEEDNKSYFFSLGDGVKARLVAAAVGKRREIGGWNLAARGPRPLKRAVPAGSVYFFQTAKALTKEQANVLMDTFHLKTAMNHSSGDQAARYLRGAGLGLACVGCWE